MQGQHQQGGLHFPSTITHILWECKGNISISKGVCTSKHNHLLAVVMQWQDQDQPEGLYLQAQSLTGCRKAIARSASGGRSALCKNSHLHTVGRQWQDQHQQGGYNHLLAVVRQWQDQHQHGGLHFASTITYNLWEGNGKISISKRVCTFPAQSLTSCGKAMERSASTRGSAICNHNHLLPVGRPCQDQQGSIHLASTITYILWEDNGRINISKEVCTLQAQSLTRCGKAMGRSALARESALCKHNHLLAAVGQWEDQH